jgi:ribosome-binding factor A
VTLRNTRGVGLPGRPSRPERVAEQLRQEISRLMITEMKDPRVRMASISQVKLSRDLRSARVMVSAIGSDEERHAVVVGLRHAAGYLRGELGHLLENLKVAPRLQFELDESIAYSVKVSTMLRELESERAAQPNRGEVES